MNRIAITKFKIDQSYHTAFIMLNENREWLDFQLFEDDSISLINNIYIGRVEHIVENISAAFIRFKDDQTGYLPLKKANQYLYTKKISKKEQLCAGDEILVQVVKDAVKTKDPVLSPNIELHGSYCLLKSGENKIGFSKKLPEETKEILQSSLTSRIPIDLNCCFTIRSNAKFATQTQIEDDMADLISQFENIQTTAVHKQSGSLIARTCPGFILRLKSIDFETIDCIITDCPDLFDQIKEYLPYIDDEKISFYHDNMVSLATLYNLTSNLDHVCSKTVWLKSGSNLIFEQLETLTFIDVNSAKNLQKKDDIIQQINKEAAIEIAKQIRLRNISGMIIIDFINMKDESMINDVISTLKKEIKRDPVPCTYHDYTKLGLVELTRKKTRKSLYEIIKK